MTFTATVSPFRSRRTGDISSIGATAFGNGTLDEARRPLPSLDAR